MRRCGLERLSSNAPSKCLWEREGREGGGEVRKRDILWERVGRREGKEESHSLGEGGQRGRRKRVILWERVGREEGGREPFFGRGWAERKEGREPFLGRGWGGRKMGGEGSHSLSHKRVVYYRPFQLSWLWFETGN